MQPYTPLNTLKPYGDRLWIVDGPIVHMRYGLGSIPFPTRMTVAKLDDGSLWVHSPTEFTEALKAELEALGPVRFLVAPNKLHWVNLVAWQDAFPDALTFAAPGLEPKAANQHFRIDRTLTDEPPAEWAGQIDQVLVPGSFMTEADFYHRPTATLILTDLLENFERARVGGPYMAFLMAVGGVLAPKGGTPRDLRLTFMSHRAHVREAAETMIGWGPTRIVVAHGICIETNAVAELRRVFAWSGLGSTP